MRIALISDLHGNEVAVRAVLRDIERVGVDETVCLGDVATLGPGPEAVIDILRDLGCRCILGNHDDFLIDPELTQTYTETPDVVASIDWCRDRLSTRDLDFLRRFRTSLEIDLGGGADLFLFHGSPRSHMENLFAETPAAELDDALGDRRATVMAGGHTHLQMLRQHRGVLLVNSGSVGAPFREYPVDAPPVLMPDHAEYATVEARDGVVHVDLRRVPVDRAALRAAVEASDVPMRGFLLGQYAD